MKPTRLALVGSAVVAVLLLAACSDSTVSSEELSSQVKSSLEESVGAPLKSVDCPEVKAETGEQFSCDAVTPNGDNLKLEGKITESDSGDVKFTVEVVSS